MDLKSFSSKVKTFREGKEKECERKRVGERERGGREMKSERVKRKRKR